MPDPKKQKKLDKQYTKKVKAKTKQTNKERGITGKEARLRVRKAKVGSKAMSLTNTTKKADRLLAKEEKLGKKLRSERAKDEPAKAPAKNLGTVSDGTPFYKRGPLYAHEAGHIDPTKEAKAKAEAKKKAENNTSTAKKVYGKASTKVENIVTPSGNVRGTRTTVTTPYTQSGTGSAKFNTAYGAAKKAGKKAFDYGGKSIKVEDAASKSGKDVRSTVSMNKISGTTLKPVGIKFTPTLPTADITIPKVPKKSKPPMPTFSMSKGRSGGGTTKLIDFNNNRVKKTKSGSGNSCGCS